MWSSPSTCVLDGAIRLLCFFPVMSSPDLAVFSTGKRPLKRFWGAPSRKRFHGSSQVNQLFGSWIRTLLDIVPNFLTARAFVCRLMTHRLLSVEFSHTHGLPQAFSGMACLH